MVFSELPGPIVLCLSLILENLINGYFKYFFCFFFSLLSPVFLLHVCHTFCNHLTVLGYSVPFCSLFLLFIQFRKSIDIFKLTDSLLGHIQLIDEPIRGNLHSVTFFPSISFLFILIVFIFLLILSMCSYMLSNFYINALTYYQSYFKFPSW